MGAIAGLFAFDGAEADAATAGALSSRLAVQGDDGERLAIAGSIAMVHRPFFTFAEERADSQPRRAESGRLLLWDGRLDNEAELRVELEPYGVKPATPSEIVLALYERRGLDAFAAFVGDFALALWDPRVRRLILAVDALGIRPLFYVETARGVAWSSKARSLVGALDLPLEVDESYVASFLANSISAQSPYRRVRVVPGGHLLVVEREQSRLHRYWSFEPRNEIRYRSDAEYEEHFRSVFTAAVASRLRADRPVFAELSGGVDSSTIVCEAARILEPTAPAAMGTPLRTLSFVFDEARSSDERPYIARIEAAIGSTGHHLSEVAFPILSKRPPREFEPDFPTNQISYLARYDAVAKLLARESSRVLLSGIGGDQAFWSESADGPFAVADRFRAGKLFHGLSDAYQWSSVLRLPLWRTIWSGGMTPFLPQFMRPAHFRGAPSGSWIDARFSRRHGLDRGAMVPQGSSAFRYPSQRIQHSWLLQTMRHFALQRCQSEGTLDVRYPYLDRRLLEFALAIPIEQKTRPGQTRSLVRRSLRGLVPPEVLDRRSKAGPTEAFQRALLRERVWLGELFADPLAARLGFLNASCFREELQRARHGLVANPAQLHRTVSLELWLRTLYLNEAAQPRSERFGSSLSTIELSPHGATSLRHFVGSGD